MARCSARSPASASVTRVYTLLFYQIGRVRGGKIGAGLFSYFDGVSPEGTRAALRRLEFGSRPVAFEPMAELVEHEFGRGVDDLFESFDRRPVAAASIGRVFVPVTTAHVILLEGLVGAATRAFLGTMMLLGRPIAPNKVVGSVPDGATWLSSRLVAEPAHSWNEEQLIMLHEISIRRA